MEFSLVDTNLIEKKSDLESILDWYEYLVLYFYPRDNTSWCSLEAKEFSDLSQDFFDLWVNIVWVSKDSEKSHCNFISKIWIKFWLIVDSEQILHNKFGVIWEKIMYGKKYLWTVRSTFLLDNKLEIIKEWRNVKVNWHANDVLNFIKSLKK